MSEHHPYYHDFQPADNPPEDDLPFYADKYDEYADEEAYETAADEYSEQGEVTEEHIPYIPEDPEPETPPQGIVWTKGRIFYAMMVTAFVLVLLVYMLVPVVDRFVNPPPPPILPPPWMA
jgi:hypothetical protein